MRMNPDLYVYKIVVDNGGAPCVRHRLLSLALCKPKIRRRAKKGSLIFGFGPKDRGEPLIYIAEVTEKPKVGAYYRSARFARRPDCIYREVSGRAQRKSNALYHRQSDERKKDVGMKFENAYVLLSRNFRYFGDKGENDYKLEFPAIKALIEGLMRGHRVNHRVGLRSELLALKKRVWQNYRKMKIGGPTDADINRRCNEDTPSIRC
jgi:hypothetical protein